MTSLSAKKKGRLWHQIGAFCLPYLCSCFLQTLYGMADLFIIGQFEGAGSITAVSIGSQVMHMLTVMIVGLAMGTTVHIGRSIGAGRRDLAAKFTGNTITLFLGGSLVLAAAALGLVGHVVDWMSTPVEAVTGTRDYLTICYMGIPFITAYNIISSIFRGMGNSRTPMYFVAIACVANIFLDLLFMGPLHLGPAGAALGTVMSQAISVVISLWMVRRHDLGIPLERADLKPRGDILKKLLRVGVPISVQDGFIQVSFLVITVIVNARGVVDAAAVGIVEKFISFVFMVPSAMLATISALGSIRIGAGRPEQAVEILYAGLKIVVTYGVALAVLIQFCAYHVVGVFTSEPDVIAAGGPYLKGYIFDTTFAGIHFSFSGYFTANGRSEISFLHNLVSIVCARIPLAYLTSQMFPDTLLPMGLATASGSLVSVVICVVAYRVLKPKFLHAGADR
ncbi:MATE family efflux transporter [Acidaminococcus sp.]|uniref:MATE family efflux transporter n=1 Tax=Acidaminococcus sp. TaxID=1872103 RepID=UPI003D7D3A6A